MFSPNANGVRENAGELAQSITAAPAEYRDRRPGRILMAALEAVFFEFDCESAQRLKQTSPKIVLTD